MAGTTYSKFFWQDWQGDLELKLCSMGAQGWWMRLLCVAGAANDRGRVTVAGRRPSPDEMRRITAAQNTDEEILSWEEELIRNHVCDVDLDGVMVSRRQRRSADGAHVQRNGGKARARSAARIGGRFAPADHQQVAPAGAPAGDVSAGGDKTNGGNEIAPAHQHAPPATINHQPSTINHKPQTPLSENLSKVDRLSKALGINLTTIKNPQNVITDFVAMELDGVDFEKDLLEAAREWAAKPTRREFSSIAYFGPMARAKRDGRRLAEGVTKANAEAMANLTRTQWIEAFNRFLKRGWWNRTEFGPTPLEANCRMPKDLLEHGEKIWNEIGQMPHDGYDEWMFPHKGPVPFFGSNVVALRKQA